MRYPRICLCAILVCLFSCVETITGQETVDLKSLADSVRKAEFSTFGHALSGTGKRTERYGKYQ